MPIGARMADAVKSQYAQTNRSATAQNFPLVLNLHISSRRGGDFGINAARCNALRCPVNSSTRFSTKANGTRTKPSVNTNGTGVSRSEINPGNCTAANTASDNTSGPSNPAETAMRRIVRANNEPGREWRATAANPNTAKLAMTVAPAAHSRVDIIFLPQTKIFIRKPKPHK